MKDQYAFAENLADVTLKPGKSAQYPFMVEFTGTPEAGKTTCIQDVTRMLEADNLKVSYVRESAEDIPKSLDRMSFDLHLFMRLNTVMSIIRNSYETQCDILLIDRGILDGIFFTKKFIEDKPDWACECNGLITMLDSLNFLLPSVSLILSCSPKVAIERKGGEGRIVTHEFIANYNKLLQNTYFSSQVVCYRIDTSYLTTTQTATKAYNIIKSEYKKNLR